MQPEAQGVGRLVNVRPDVRLHIVTTGDHDAPPVIMLHGFPEFWWSWRHQLKFLGENGFRGIAVDLRGFNHSDKPKSGYDPATQAGDILGLLDALGYESAVIMGHDFGGFLAYTLALLHPQRVKKLVILDALHPAIWASYKRLGKVGMRVFVQLTRLGHSLGNPLLAAANERIGIGWVMQWLAKNRAALPQSTRVMYSRAYARAHHTATAYAPAVAAWLRESLPSDLYIHQPTLVLWSGNDPTAPIVATHHITETVPNARVIIVPDAGHWLQQEQPDFVNQAVLDFLREG